MTVAQIMEAIDLATEPSVMGPDAAKEFLESIQAEIESRLDGLSDDARNRDE